MRILIGEDDPENRDILRRLLRRLGAEVLIAEDGADAVAAFREEGSFDLILLDLSMPEMNGFAALKAMRAIEAERGRRRTPAIALSGADDDPAIRRAGFDAFLQKPIDAATLRDALAQWTKRAE